VSVRKSVRVLDALTILCAAGAIGLALFGAIREYILGVVVSIRWTHAVFAVLALALVRHALVPSPSIFAALRSRGETPGQDPALRDAMLAFWLTRPTVLLVGLLAVTAIGTAPKSQEAIGRDPLTTLPARFDSGWYAQHEGVVAASVRSPAEPGVFSGVSAAHARRRPRDRRRWCDDARSAGSAVHVGWSVHLAGSVLLGSMVSVAHRARDVGR
jgi:hypothetical protein